MDAGLNASRYSRHARSRTPRGAAPGTQGVTLLSGYSLSPPQRNDLAKIFLEDVPGIPRVRLTMHPPQSSTGIDSRMDERPTTGDVDLRGKEVNRGQWGTLTLELPVWETTLAPLATGEAA